MSFHVGGHYLHDRCPFEMLGPGVQASPELVRAEQMVWFEGPVIPLPDSQQQENYPWPQNGSVRVATDAPLGMRRWRVWTSQGVTESMKFVVGDLPEIIEQEIDGDPIPTHVELPVTINGRMFPREDVDIWTFDAEAGRSYTCEVLAARLGSPLDSRLAAYGPEHQLVAENGDGRGLDSLLQFTAVVNGLHSVEIHDANFGGLQHYVYRLTITDGPHVEHVYPLGGQRGTSRRFTLFGQNLPPDGVMLSLPNVSTDTFAESLCLEGRTTNPVVLELSDLPEVLEGEPNDEAGQSRQAVVGSVLNGQIDSPGDVDCWSFDLRKGECVEFDLRAARCGSRLDSVVTVFDAAGQELAANDDWENGQPDSRLTFTAPVDGRYRVAVRDRFASRGGVGFAYRLYATATAALEPDYALRLASDALTLLPGGQAKLKVTAVRQHGFQEEITLAVEGLPAGVTISNHTIPANKGETELTFQVDPTAKVAATKLRLHGSAMLGGQPILRLADKPADSPGDLAIDHVLLAVAIPTPFKLMGAFETKYAARGSTYLRHYQIDRGGYVGPLTIRLAERQVRHLQGVTGPTLVVPAGESEFDYPIKLPPWMELGRTSRTALMAVADIRDRDGQPHRVSYTSHEQSDQIIVLVDPGQVDITLDRRSLAAQPDQTASVGVQVGRGQGITGSVTVELVTPRHIRGVVAAAIEIPAHATRGTLALQFDHEPRGPWNMPLTVRATAMKDGLPYTAEEELTVVAIRDIPQSPALAEKQE